MFNSESLMQASSLPFIFAFAAIVLSFYVLSLAMSIRSEFHGIHEEPTKSILDIIPSLKDGQNCMIADYIWSFDSIDGDGRKYKVKTISSDFLSFIQVFQLMKDSDECFMRSFTKLFFDFGFESVFFECTPINFELLSIKIFEFVLIPAPSLNDITADILPFSSQLSSKDCQNKDVVSFNNLAGDAKLVVPCYKTNYNINSYSHLQRFMRSASKRQILNLFSAVSETAMAVLNARKKLDNKNQNLWISTSGLGVYWLHVRLDSKPKYYNYINYKNSA